MSPRGWLAVAWAVLASAPLVWWLAGRRRLDVWGALPVPAALLDAAGEVRASTGPPGQADVVPLGPLPPPGQLARGVTSAGTPVALAGVRGGGAVAVALPADPVRHRRDELLAELGARLAHDIGTPLGALQGHLDLLAHAELPQQARLSVETCQRQLARLEATAQDLLTLTRVRAGSSRRSPVLAGVLVEEAAAALLPRADEAGVRLRVEVPGEPVRVDVAGADLVRALRNLVLNALVHPPPPASEVLVSATLSGEGSDAVTFRVVDGGPGLSARQLAELAEPLARGPGAAAGGAGLGLAIVNEVLAAHGSRLETGRTPGPGPGRAMVFFTLPRARP